MSLNTLIAWQVDAVNTANLVLLLALTLLVARVLANHVNLTVATDDFALVAHLSFYRRTYLSCVFLFVSAGYELYISPAATDCTYAHMPCNVR